MTSTHNDPRIPTTIEERNICIKRCVYYHNCLSSLNTPDETKECEEKVKKCIKSICYFNPPKYLYKFPLRNIFKI